MMLDKGTGEDNIGLFKLVSLVAKIFFRNISISKNI